LLIVRRKTTQASGEALWAKHPRHHSIPEIKVPEVVSGIVTGTRLY
jgi:hypothetical protein